MKINYWQLAAAFLLGLMFGPLAHGLMEAAVKFITGKAL
jgi:hypothetical protein